MAKLEGYSFVIDHEDHEYDRSTARWTDLGAPTSVVE